MKLKLHMNNNLGKVLRIVATITTIISTIVFIFFATKIILNDISKLNQPAKKTTIQIN